MARTDTTAKNPTTWLKVTDCRYEYTDSGHIYLAPVIIRNTGTFQPTLGSPDDPGLDHLILSATWSDPLADVSYGWGASMTDMYWMHEAELEAALRTLQTIRRKLDKYEADWGAPASFGAWVSRIVKALGLAGVITDGAEMRVGDKWYRVLDNAQAITYHIDMLIDNTRSARRAELAA